MDIKKTTYYQPISYNSYTSIELRHFKSLWFLCTQPEVYTKYSSELFLFWWIQVLHYRFHQQANCKDLGCWASRWPQLAGYEQSMCCEMILHIKRMCHKPMVFEIERTRVETTEICKFTMHSHTSGCWENTSSSAGQWSSAMIRPSYNLFKQQAPKYGDWEGRTSFLAITLSQSEPLQFLCVGSY